MPEKSQDRKFLEELGEITYASSGFDSKVEKFTTAENESVLKEYSSLQAAYGEEITHEILQCYYLDTERAQLLLEKYPNPLNQKIVLNRKSYDLEYVVIPQGGLLLEGNPNKDFKGESNSISASQKFIDGLNLKELEIGLYHQATETNGQAELESNHYFTEQMEVLGFRLIEHLNKNLGVEFGFALPNIKPFVIEDEKKIRVVMTDLAPSLALYFECSPSTLPIRQKIARKKQNSQL